MFPFLFICYIRLEKVIGACSKWDLPDVLTSTIEPATDHQRRDAIQVPSMRYCFFILAAVSCLLRIPTLSFTIQNALITSSTTVSSVSSLLLTATVILLFSCHSRIRQGSGHYDHRWVQEYARIPISKYTPRGSRYHRPAIMQTISGWDR